MQIIKKYNFESGRFFIGSKKAINDTDLSDGALRLYLILCNNKHAFITNKAALMNKAAIKKIDTFNKRITELQNAGYLYVNPKTGDYILLEFEGEAKTSNNFTAQILPSSWWHKEPEQLKFLILEVLIAYKITFKNRALDDKLRVECVNQKIPETTMNGIKEFIAKFPNKQDRMNYIEGLSRDRYFWNNPTKVPNALYAMFVFKQSTIEHRYTKALNMLGIKRSLVETMQETKAVTQPEDKPDNDIRLQIQQKAEEIAKRTIVTDKELVEWVRINTNEDIHVISKKEMLKLYRAHVASCEYSRLMEEQENN